MPTITIISNNTAITGYKKEHGLSLLINYECKKLLFDTGNESAFVQNFNKLNIDTTSIDYLMISHGHNDHCGNINFILTSNPNIKTFIHPEGLKKRFSIHKDRDPMVSNIGITKVNKDCLLKNKTIYSEKPTNIYKSMFITGYIPRLTQEDTGGPFFNDFSGKEIDTIPDDQSLFIKTDEGLIIITGCCHSGLINSVEYIKKISGINKVKSIIGGLHLAKVSDKRLLYTIKYLNDLNMKEIYPGHCTGQDVIKTLILELNCTVITLDAGSTYCI